jgi:hypothetical protein
VGHWVDHSTRVIRGGNTLPDHALALDFPATMVSPMSLADVRTAIVKPQKSPKSLRLLTLRKLG